MFGRRSDAARGQIRPTRPRPIQSESLPPMFDIMCDYSDGTVVLEHACEGMRAAQRRIDYYVRLGLPGTVWMRRC